MNQIVFIENNRAVTDSLVIAEMFGKRHDNVIRDIENQMNMAGEEFSLLNFEESNYENRGKQYPKFNLTEEAFTLVVFSYNTREAVQTKIKFIKEFKRMREYTEQQQQQPQLPSNYKEALVALLEKVEQNEQLELENKMYQQQVADMKPKVTYVDEVLKCTDLLTTTQIADDYGMSAQAFNKLLHEHGIQYKINGQWLLYGKYKGEGYTKSDTTTYRKPNGTEGVSLLTKWTQKGRLFLYEILKSKGILPTMEQIKFRLIENKTPTELGA
ncbi:phage antirepressor KilAC domain-containing protein [Viridibacillus arvi]|uniref:phage antirepressor KilAC domain-containing protein n=1 Tax=Viridibacillus arvi TaxID=263475 RepID=UPI003D292996